jgi:hypothetical protein
MALPSESTHWWQPVIPHAWLHVVLYLSSACWGVSAVVWTLFRFHTTKLHIRHVPAWTAVVLTGAAGRLDKESYIRDNGPNALRCALSLNVDSGMTYNLIEGSVEAALFVASLSGFQTSHSSHGHSEAYASTRKGRRSTFLVPA